VPRRSTLQEQATQRGRGRVLLLVGVSGGVGRAGDGGTEVFELAAAGGAVGVGMRADLPPSRGHG
jgi:hypothetical protein